MSKRRTRERGSNKVYWKKQTTKLNAQKGAVESPVKKSKHVWTAEEREVIQKYFKSSALKIGKAPRQQDCLGFIESHPAFRKYDWKEIKFCVHNMILKTKKIIKKPVQK